MPREAEPVVPETVMQWDGDLSIFVQDSTHHVKWNYAPDHDRGGYVDVGLSGGFATVSTDDEEGTAHFPAPLARLIARKLLAIADAIYPEPAPASPAPSASPQYYVGADRGDLWIPVHTTGCATEEEARKVLDLVRKGDEEGGPFAVIRSYEDFTPTKASSSLSTLLAQIEGLPAVPRHLRITSDCLSRAEVLALFDALT